MSTRRFLHAVLIGLAFFQLGSDKSSCQVMHNGPSSNPDPFPTPVQSFSDNFSGGLSFWRGAVPDSPGLDITQGNPVPAMQVGSAALRPTGAVTLSTFDFSEGLIIEADIYYETASPPPAAAPDLWVGLSPTAEPTTIPDLAAGQYIDATGTLHLQVNGVDVGATTAPLTGQWHRLSTTIRTDGQVEFRLNGTLIGSGGQVNSAYNGMPMKVGGDGYPERPKIDNVSVRKL